MIKKYKNSIIATIISIMFLIITYVLIGNVYSLYNPSEKEFMNDKASNLLGKELYMGGDLWNKLDKEGKLTCFWHKESGYSGHSMNNKIHSVFDVGFDQEK